MKIFPFLIGVVASLYTLAGIVQFVGILWTSDPTSTMGASTTAAGIVPICLGLIVSVIAFRSAFGRPAEK